MRKKDPAADAAADPWKKKLQDTLKQERPSARRWGFWLALGLLAVLALVVYLVYPRPGPPLPPLITFDKIVRQVPGQGQVAPVMALFDLPDDEDAIPRLEGRRVIFRETRIPIPGQELTRVEVVLGEDRIARADFATLPGFNKVVFEALCPGKDGQPGVKDQAHIFVVGGARYLLVINLEGTLSLATMEDWDKSDPRPVPVPEASPALMEAYKAGVQPVYLALETDRPVIYYRQRLWTRSRFTDGTSPLPEGPILGREEYPGSTAAAYAKVLGVMKEQFPIKPVALSASPEAARRFQEAGWRTIFVGPGEAPAGVERMRSWEELYGLLHK